VSSIQTSSHRVVRKQYRELNLIAFSATRGSFNKICTITKWVVSKTHGNRRFHDATKQITHLRQITTSRSNVRSQHLRNIVDSEDYRSSADGKLCGPRKSIESRARRAGRPNFQWRLDRAGCGPIINLVPNFEAGRSRFVGGCENAYWICISPVPADLGSQGSPALT